MNELFAERSKVALGNWPARSIDSSRLQDDMLRDAGLTDGLIDLFLKNYQRKVFLKQFKIS